MSSKPAISPTGITQFPLNGRFPRIDIAAPNQTQWTDAQEQAWQRACAANPRLHDNPIWSATSADADRITVQLDRYKRLTIQSDPAIGDLGVRHIGVKGLMTAPDERTRGGEQILLARRGPRTRAYPGLWEIAPAGGVDVVENQPLSVDSIIATLIQEAREELGIDASPSAAAARPFLMVRDETARSLVFMVHLPWPSLLDHAWRLPQTWEYTDSRWLTRDGVKQWLQSSPHQITPPAAAALDAFLRQQGT